MSITDTLARTPAEVEVLRNVYQSALDNALERAEVLEEGLTLNKEWLERLNENIAEGERQLETQRRLIEDILDLAEREGITLYVPVPEELQEGTTQESLF